jgi:twitching motility protein PilT
VETSGFQPAQPEEPVAFAAGPGLAPEEEQAAAGGGWNYSFVAEPPAAEPAAAEPAVAEPAVAEPAVAPSALDNPEPQYAAPEAPAPAFQADYFSETPAPVAETPYVPASPYVPEAPAAPSQPPAEAYVPAFPTQQVAAEPLAPLPLASPDWHADVVVAPEKTVLVAEPEANEAAYQRGSTEQALEEEDISLNDLLMHVLDTGASDLHLTSGARPAIRLNGSLQQMESEPILTPPVIQRVIYAALTQKQREKFEENLELDFAYSVPGRARFRVNVYRQRDAIGAAFRIIPFEIKKLEDLGVPPSVANFASLARGFVLVTGPTGSGKSTTLASLIDMANRTRSEHIMTVEDPIEFLHRHQKSLVNQREVGEDTWSFANALKHVLRQDPDIILVGEMRDLETISVALTAAETGHLVFATLHTQDAAQTIDRVIDVFPPEQQQQVRVQLAGTLQGIVCQTLAKTTDGRGRAVATEVLVATPAIRNLIREGKTHQIYSSMQAGSKHGMHTMDQHLAELVQRGTITYETGLEKCHHVEDFNRLAGRG